MKCSINSWHAQLYFLTYGGYTNKHRYFLPSNLCPYFWKLAFAILVFPLVAALSLLPFSLNYALNKWQEEEHTILDEIKCRGIGSHLFAYITVDVILFVLYAMVAAWFSTDESIIAIGIFGWFITAIVVIVALIIFIQKLIVERRMSRAVYTNPNKREPRPNIVWEYIKAKKNKYCPKITWK